MILGLCIVFRRFINKFARIAASLTAKMCQGGPALFGDLDGTEREAFEMLKAKLIYPTVLPLSRPEGRYKVDTDACEKQVGRILVLKQPK